MNDDMEGENPFTNYRKTPFKYVRILRISDGAGTYFQGKGGGAYLLSGVL